MDAPLPTNLVPCWGDFLSQPRTLDDLFLHPLLFPLQRKREMLAMHAIARELNPQVIMEIGADKGGSVWAWVHELPSVKAMIACEIRGTPYSELMEKSFPHIEFLWLPESSYTKACVQKVKDWLRAGRIDAMFIDGDKGKFRTDYLCYQPYLNKPSTVFMHDICANPMKRDFELCRTGHDWSIIEDASECQGPFNDPITSYDQWLQYWPKGVSCSVGVIQQ